MASHLLVCGHAALALWKRECHLAEIALNVKQDLLPFQIATMACADSAASPLPSSVAMLHLLMGC